MPLNRFSTLALLILAVLAQAILPAAGDPPPTPASAETEADLSAAFTRRLESAAGAKALTFDLFTPELDAAFTSPDGQTAVLWLALRDDSGRLLATEPGLTLARQTSEGWQVLLPGDPGWDETLAALPEGMLPLEQMPAPKGMSPSADMPAALTGYYLPYAAGTARWMEGSIFHFSQLPPELAYLGYPSCQMDTCRYAYDFTDSDHFPLLASKDGYVLAARDSCPDGSETCANYIVLRSANGAPYQIYLHLAHGTIPDKLTPGTAVKRGQYLGDSDDTGYSTSQHVHFMVTSDIWLGSGYNDYYWGHSIDVRFADVPINNGIPRNCYEVTHLPIYDGATECIGNKADPRNPANDWFVSGNVGAYPPTGALTRPAAGVTVNNGPNPLIDVTASASDDVRVTAIRLVVKINGQWVEVGPKVAGATGDWDVDLCAAGPLNGPVDVALRAWDHEGNVSSALAPRTIQVDHACPPPVSQLTAPELFESTAVRLNWSASSAGAGLGSFELQWRTEPGSWSEENTIRASSSQRSAWFGGQPGGTYAFRLRAFDANGQPEPWPAGDAAEITATLPSPDDCDADDFEPDDSPAQAVDLAVGEAAQRSLCGQGNLDWFRLTLEGETRYTATARSVNGGAAVQITVYAGDGTTVLASGAAGDVGQTASVTFTPPAAGSYYLRAEPLTAELFGTDAVYELVVSDSQATFLPLVMR